MTPSSIALSQDHQTIYVACSDANAVAVVDVSQGDMKEGNGDPSLVMFGKNVTPNHHKIAREFVLLDNFYVNADVSADGLYWTTAAIAPDTTVKTLPIEYADRIYGFAANAHFNNAIQPQRGKSNPEGVRTAPAGYIWGKAIKAGVSLRNYGFMAINLPHLKPYGIHIQEVEDPVLAPYTNMYFRQHDRSFPDVKRMHVIFKDLDQWERTGNMPQLILITIGNDHTEGTRPGACTPSACVAENDQALGVLVERMSKSKFWPSMAIFVLEDDSQDGPDHVDSHRSLAFVISPYAKRRYVDSTFYNTTSVLRTIELILGMEPMTVFDAGARPMANCFQQKPDLTPYKSEPPRVSLTAKSPASSPTAARSLKLDFSRSDLNDDQELNAILWLAIKGTQPPPPVRSWFSR